MAAATDDRDGVFGQDARESDCEAPAVGETQTRAAATRERASGEPAVRGAAAQARARPWVAIQRNPKSGAGLQRALLIDLIHVLKRHGLQPRVFVDRAQLDRRVQHPCYRDSLVCIVAAGGDGTVSDVINRFPGVRVAILPAGTENLLSRFLGIPRSGTAVGEMIAGGRTQVLDLCALGDRRFVVVGSAGLDAEVIHRAHAIRTGNITRLSYFQPLMGSLRGYPFSPLRVWLDDDPEPRTARLVIVANLPMYALNLPVAWSAVGTDGLLDVRLFHGRSAFQMLRYYYNVWRGGHEQVADVECFRARRLRIESETPVPLQVDGDPAGWTPAEFHVLPGALEVFVPPGNEGSGS